jgi:hypothetical protein
MSSSKNGNSRSLFNSIQKEKKTIRAERNVCSEHVLLDLGFLQSFAKNMEAVDALNQIAQKNLKVKQGFAPSMEGFQLASSRDVLLEHVFPLNFAKNTEADSDVLSKVVFLVLEIQANIAPYTAGDQDAQSTTVLQEP